MELWNNFLSSQEKVLGKPIVEKWLRPLKIVDFDARNLYLEATDAFQIAWFEEHIRPNLKSHFLNSNQQPITVHFSRPQKGKKRPPHHPVSSPPLSLTRDPLDSEMVWDRFILGHANEPLFRFLSELIQDNHTQRICNPIYLYGTAATGKTHLLVALAHLFQKKGLHPLYVRTDTFTDHVVSAIRASAMKSFRESYRTADILLVDDVHVLARRLATQEEFFHTFNTLHTAGKQIILTSNRPAALLEGIEPRLVSRFEWGIAFHLEKLSSQELSLMIRKRCESAHFPLNEDIIGWLVKTFPRPDCLNKAFDALLLRVHLEEGRTPSEKRVPLELSCVTQLLDDLVTDEKRQKLSSDKILGAIASFYGVSTEDILGKSHSQEYVLPRHLAIYLCRTQLGYPFTKIGEIFSRDHSTIMTSVKLIQKKLSEPNHELHQVLTKLRF